jgi:hypothetical protein
MKRNKIMTIFTMLPDRALSSALVPALACILVLATAQQGGAISSDTSNDLSISNSSVEIVANSCGGEEAAESLVEMHFHYTLSGTGSSEESCSGENGDNPLTNHSLSVTLGTYNGTTLVNSRLITFPIDVGPSGNNGQSDGTLTTPYGAVSDAEIEMLGGKACQRFNFNAVVGTIDLGTAASGIVHDLQAGRTLKMIISTGDDHSALTGSGVHVVQHVELHTPSCYFVG